MVILLVAILLMVVGGYSITRYWWLLMAIILVAIGGYFIHGYWCLLYYKLLLVISCYITTIDDYFIINYC
jgi:hypothetical protein